MLEERIAESVRALKLSAELSKKYYGQKLVVTYSGGKDSDVMLHIAENNLKPDDFEVINSHTSVDAPPTVKHIKDTKKRLSEKGIQMTIRYPVGKDGKQLNMVKLIVANKNPPWRNVRYCCRYLKETATPNRFVALGVRGGESVNRQGRDIFSTLGVEGKGVKTGGGRFFSLDHVEEAHHGNGLCVDEALTGAMERKEGMIVNPIYYWTDSEIWQYIRKYDVSVNPLYFPPYNYKRVGCLLCPMATYSEKMKQCVDFPGYKKLYIRAFDKMLEARRQAGLVNRREWQSGEDVFNWWVEEYKHNVRGQISIEEWMKSMK